MSEKANEVYTVEEVAKILRVNVNTAYRAIRAEEIPVIRICDRMLVPRVRLDALLTGEKAAQE